MQDDIKLTPDLTINVGMRYDYFTPPENSLQYPAIDLNNPLAPINTVVKVKNDTNNFAPRFGFAWNPHGSIFSDGKTVFHGGLGLFYDTDFTNIATNGAQSSPNAPTGLLTSTTGRGLANATSLLSTITPTLSPMSSVQSVASNLRNPLTWQWNFGLERQLPAQIKLTVNYVGNHGGQLYANQQLNYFINGSRINPTRNAVNIRANRADSEYNSLQTEVTPPVLPRSVLPRGLHVRKRPGRCIRCICYICRAYVLLGQPLRQWPGAGLGGPRSGTTVTTCRLVMRGHRPDSIPITGPRMSC